MTRLKYGLSFVVGSLLVLLSNYLPAAETLAKPRLVVFLVRHAEKVDASRDPELSSVGKERAKKLALVLRDANIKHIHSSDFIRTRDTAAPFAARLKLRVELYDPNDLPTLLKKLRQTGDRHLVVGHSTSTPAAVKMLGGKPGSVINEAGEFDRLYIITVDTNGNVSTVLMRYGRPFKETES
ncbi:MAG: histidine phosphatase family protein [Pirellulaceae bacterium]|jgi:phosphohistidine phosphatase SixA|nr:histidine phosphatase family protein [Pirellulaceae bacterium]HJN13198.1 histidine phosphatase family protein [Pirellulaceae bacterium]